MAETISPVGYGERTDRWLIAVALHAFGAGLTAAVFGAALGAVGALLGAPWGEAGIALVGGAAALYAAREAFGLPIPVPAARRQVPDWWRTFFSWPVAAGLYGAGLGVGFLTFLAHGGLVVVSVAAVASGRPLVGATLVGAFGLARGSSALVAWPVRTRDAGTALVERLSGVDPARLRALNAIALTSVAVAAAVSLSSAGAWFASADGRFAPAGVLGSKGDSLAAAFLAVAFGWAAAAKLSRRDRWRRTLAAYALPPGVARVAVVAVPGAELAVPALVVIGLPTGASWFAMGLLAAFSLAIVAARIRGGGRSVVCGCYGGRVARDYRLLLGRNAALAVVAALAAGATPQLRLRLPGAPATGDLLPFVLASVGLTVACWTVWRAAAWLARGRAA